MRPTLAELRERITQDLGIAKMPQSFTAQLVNSLAGTFHMLYAHTELKLKNLLPDTAKKESLERWAKIWGVQRRPATPTIVSGTIDALGPATILKGTKFYFGNETFSTMETVNIDVAGLITLKLSSEKKSELLEGASKLAKGVVMKIGITKDNLSTELILDTIEKGTHEEPDDSLKERLLFAIQTPPQGGAVIDYLNWTSSVPGVHRGFVRTAKKDSPGKIYVSFITKDLTQDEAIKNSILQKLEPLAPCGATIEFQPLNFVKFPINFGIDPTELGEKAKEELKTFFINHFTPKGFYDQTLIASDGTIYLSDLHGVLASITGEKRHTITSPITNVTADTGVFYCL